MKGHDERSSHPRHLTVPAVDDDLSNQRRVRRHRRASRRKRPGDFLCNVGKLCFATLREGDRIGTVDRLGAGRSHSDVHFPAAMEYRMPPSGGMGMGIDQLLMALTASVSARLSAFPLVRPQ
jgi:tRNA synthetases class II (D, K and N)